MKSRTGAIALLQYSAIRLAAFVLQLFPIDVNLRTARVLAGLWWRLDGRHRCRAREHLREAFSNRLSEQELDDLSLRCFRHWAMFAVEFFCALRLLNEWSWPRYIAPTNAQEMFRIMLEKRGAILLTGHFGNFELTAFLAAAFGFEVAAIMRPLDNKYINDFVVRTRASKGLLLLNKFGATAEAEEILRRGGAVGFVADQDARHKGLFVDFFGRKASTYKSIGLLAIRCDVPIVIGYARRTGDRFHYQVGVQRIIHPREWRDREDPLLWITQEYTSAIEAMVRDAPEQYLWLHRRWKSQPAPAGAGKVRIAAAELT